MTVTVAASSGQQPKKTEPYVPPLLPLEEAWRLALPAPPTAGPTIAADRIYVPLAGHVLAVARETGATVWDVELETSVPPLVTDDRVLIAAGVRLHALAADTGAPLWQVDLPSAPTVPLRLAAGLLVGLMPPDHLWAIRPEDGERVWATNLGGGAQPLQFTTTNEGVYLSGDSDRVLAVDLRDGMVRWEQRLPAQVSAPAVSKDRVLVGTTTRTLFALNAKDGSLAWRWVVGGDVIGAGVDESSAYFASLDNLLRAVNRGNGNQRWKQILPTRPTSPPRAMAGVVLVTGLSPTLAAFNARTGAAMGSYVLPPPVNTTSAPEIMGEPAIDPDARPFAVAVVVAVRDGRLIALRPTAMMFRETAPTALTALPGTALTRERLP